VGTVLLALFIFPAVARRLADWLWFREIGYERVFLTKIAAQWALGFGAGLLGGALLYANARFALREVAIQELVRGRPAERQRLFTRFAELAVLPASLFFGLMVGLSAAGDWLLLLQFAHRTPFGVADALFGRDVGYYVFTVPLIDAALGIGMLLLVLAAAVAVPMYAARDEIYLVRGRLRVDPMAQTHLRVLAAALLLLVAAQIHFVGAPGLLYSHSGPLVGASYTDIHATLPALRLLALAAAASAALLLWGLRAPGRARLGRDLAIAAGGLLALSAVGTGIVPALVRRLVVQPNELARERPQIERHIAATRAAWGLNAVELRDLEGSGRRLTTADIAANRATVRNVRLWDREPLLQTFGQLQAIRTYYEFVSVDDDRYRIGGELRQVLLSARELDASALPTRSFINEHLTFTHGMGITLGPSNQVTTEGLPVLFIKDLPPASSIPIRVTRPEIYFGELANDYVLVKTRQREFDVPAASGAGDVYTTYAGRGGVPVGSFWRRLVLAVRFGSLNILLSGDVTDSTRALYHRRVAERAGRALPFLRIDDDPYLVITDAGRLVWVIDGYTATDRYPYSQRLADGTSYLRNSVKVLVDAYDGDVRAYLADPADPIARTFAGLYPGVLRPLASMPDDVRAHVRYPSDLFRAQAALYATYHMVDPETFYHREDQWQVPARDPQQRGRGGDAADDPFMRHIVMRLPGEPDPEFLLMLPFTPRQKDNLAAWMVARNDGEHYGQLVAYRFPRQSLVYGPRQVLNRINQDPEISRQISLWDQRGSEVIWGNMLVIPIEESLVYVQPLYLRAQGGRIPELKRVVVAYESGVVMAETFEQGLTALFGGAAGAAAAEDLAAASPTAPTADTTRAATAAAAAGTAGTAGTATARDALIRQATDHYERARAAQRADDWAKYGEEMRKLGEALARLRQAPR